jgi:DNA mismatch repair protein MutS
MTAIESKISPMMAQWHACKKMAEGAVLLFRMGDFYEAFYEDAILLAKELDLTLTKRTDIPMSGVPHHTSEGYIDRLVARGYRVAVAEQMEDPKLAKGLVQRQVTRMVTPGTLINSSLLSDRANNYLASVMRIGSLFGLAFLDLTTAEFRTIEFEKEQELLNELYRLQPAECVTSRKFREKHGALFENCSFITTEQEDWRFEHQIAHDTLLRHFKVRTLDGFGLRGQLAAINAAGALLNYLQEVLMLPTGHISQIQPYTNSDRMAIDPATQRHLELICPQFEGQRTPTLLSILDQTETPMGARLLKHWIVQPLMSVEEIGLRQDSVEALLRQPQILERVNEQLKKVRDLERLMMKISSGYATPRDIVALKESLLPLPALKSLLQPLTPASTFISQDEADLEPLPELVQLIERALVDAPPLRLSDGGLFREGFNRELDELRSINLDHKAWIARYQNHLREETGIRTLKVGYTKMFGYYIEVSKGQAERVPDFFQRRQTLVNAERFITPDLKNYENKVLHAEERIAAIESELFASLRQEVAKEAEKVLRTAKAVARLDCFQSLALVAARLGYIRPIVDQSGLLQIVGGRHPVIEAANLAETFVPNDTLLDDQSSRLLLITGPNMAGKSTYIRQVALIVIMAQMGAFVPAKSAKIGVIDKLFSRIGASDDLARGQSTFMVEMTETANILNNATSRSLVILDEIGRGTSTYDGISIAWAIAEYLLTTEGRQAKTLFATHYWELTKLEEKMPGAVNYHVAVHEAQDQIIFLRKIVRGGTDRSYGIHVAQLAGLPQEVLVRAREILVHLEENANRKSAFEPSPSKRLPPPKIKSLPSTMQLTFFGN